MSLTKSEKRKSFEFRMSKKVAELTQVVHMLFMKNHEREVEIDTLKEAYENEIDCVIKDAKEMLSACESRILELEKSVDESILKTKKIYEDEIRLRDLEWENKIKDVEKNVLDEKSQSDKVRDLLVAAQRDLERIQTGYGGHLNQLEKELAERKEIIDDLTKKIDAAEKQLRENEKKHAETISLLEQSNVKLQREAAKYQTAFDKQRSEHDIAISRALNVENEIRQLKREFQRRLQEFSLQQQNRMAASMNGSFVDRDGIDEVDHLRKELMRYKMELANRDMNLNRVFTEHNPVLIDSRAGAVAAASARPQRAYSSRGARQERDRSFYEEEHPKTPYRKTSEGPMAHLQQIYQMHQQGNAGAPVFPVLERSYTSSANRLTRPKPPAKHELLATKNS